MAFEQGQEVPSHDFKAGKSYVVAKGKTYDKKPREIKVHQVAGNYILVQEVNYDDSPEFKGWIEGQQYAVLAEIPYADGTANVQ